MSTVEKQTDWSQPAEVDDVEIAFPAHGVDRMPAWEEIPEEFRTHDRGNKWVRFQIQWFYEGMNLKQIKPKKNVDPWKAIRHLKTIQGSFEPKHEHKEAGVAYLSSLWFDDVLFEGDFEKNRDAWRPWCDPEDDDE